MQRVGKAGSQPIEHRHRGSGKPPELVQSGSDCSWPNALAPAQPHLQQRTRVRAALRLMAAGIGLAAGMSLLGLVWPESDQGLGEETPPRAGDLAEAPPQPISVLLIGSDADRPGVVRNDAAPAGPANSDALLLAHVHPQKPLQLMHLPVETAVQLPGDLAPVALGSLYRRGGPALVADASAQLLNLPKGQPERYLVLPRRALRDLVDGMGRLELSPDRSMRYRDNSQRYSINLDSGLQMLDGRQVEQLLRFRDETDAETKRRERQQLAAASLLQQMGQGRQLQQLPDLLSSLQNVVDTNLSQSEALSLLSVALQPDETTVFSTLPLRPPISEHSQLRALDLQAERSWPQ